MGRDQLVLAAQNGLERASHVLAVPRMIWRRPCTIDDQVGIVYLTIIDMLRSAIGTNH